MKVEDDTQSLTGTNDRSIKDSKILARKIDFDVVEEFDAFKLMLLMSDLAAKNSDLLYILLLNNGLGIILLLIDNLVDVN